MGKFEKIVNDLNQINKVKAELTADLSRMGTFKLKAKGHLVKISNPDSLAQVIKLFAKEKIKYRALGLGANQLIEDAEDFFYLKFLWNPPITFTPEMHTYEFSGGVTLNKLTKLAVDHELKGWDVFTGVPATLGGAIVMNAGTNLGEIGDLVKVVKYVTKSGELKEHLVNRDSFVYRSNNFLTEGDFVYAVVMKNLGREEGIGQKINDYLEYRTKTQPLWDKTCGCTYKNFKEGELVLPAGMYIDLAGLKGLQCGNIKISEKHANFFVNTENATKQEVIVFIERVQNLLSRSYGVTFEREIKIN